MEIKWTLLSAFWKCLIGIHRGIRRAKKNYYCLAILCFMVILMGVYMWSWYMCIKIQNEMHPYQVNTRITSDTECQFPDVDPFSAVAQRYNRNMPKIVCDGVDWVQCNMTECKITPYINDSMKNIECHYKDIIYVDEHSYAIASPVKVLNDDIYRLNKSDFFKVSCFGYNKNGFGLLSKRWHGYNSGIRPIEPIQVPPGRESTINILMIAFDSASHNGFIRKLAKSYKFLIELGAVILKGYNIVGDGTPDALFPILSGRTELQHPYARQRYSKEIFLDPDLFIFHTVKQDGYQTAYYEDMPWIGSFQYRYNGFSRRPADHYLRSFLMEETKDGSKWWKGKKQRYCIGATPQYLFLLNLTKQFMNLKTKRFCFTFIADISHDEVNLMSTADDDLVDFLNYTKNSGILNDTLVIVMGDHGPRFSPMRATYQGRLEERLAFMSFILPQRLINSRPDALYYLKLNAERLTTPFDIHTTILDAMGLKQFASDFYVPNSNLKRGLSLLKPVPKSRTCEEAGILPHWCVCLNNKWVYVSRNDPMHDKVTHALTEYINNITEEKRTECEERVLTSVEWVIRQDLHPSKSDKTPQSVYYQAMIVMSPGRAVFEGSMQHNQKLDTFIIFDKDVSRISAYGNEPDCISATHTHLNKYCYCRKVLKFLFK